MSKILYFTICIYIAVFFQSNNVVAQTIQRETIASSGYYVYFNNFLVKETIGQPYHTQAFYNADVSFRPGFQQPETSISIKEVNFTLSLFPNPTHEFLNINASGIFHNVTMRVIDATGNILRTEKMDELSMYKLNVSALVDGLYVITFTTSSQRTVSSKFVISNP